MSNHWFNRWSRKLHRWGAIITLAPMLLVILTGILLQVKKEVPWVQPPTKKGSIKNELALTFDELVEIAKKEEELQIESLADIDRFDVRPKKGLAKIKANNNWELQLDANTGEVLHKQYRNSDWIEALHDGSWFSDFAKLYIFLPNGLILLGLWFTGAYLWILPIWKKRANRLKREAAKKEKTAP
ncbi:MAG: PepSY domain-containing protein [Pirellulaceae bacterium]|nr:PepSY domain-containing protein [Pirellulaceae bacterium]